MKKISPLSFKNKLKKYLSEGYPQKQALAMTYSHFNIRGNMKKNPDSEKHSVSWLKNKITEKQFNELASYYRGYQKAKIRWFDKASGEGVIRLSDGPLKDFSVFVHGSAFGGDVNFGQNTSFEPEENLPVLVKLLVDWDYIQVSSMIKDKSMKKNPAKKTPSSEIKKIFHSPIARRLHDSIHEKLVLAIVNLFSEELDRQPEYITIWERTIPKPEIQIVYKNLSSKDRKNIERVTKHLRKHYVDIDLSYGDPKYYEDPDMVRIGIKSVQIPMNKNWGDKNIFTMKKNPTSKECIFKTPDQMREFLNKHLKDKWSWKKNKIVVHTGQGNWKIARAVEDFFKLAGFQGANSEMDERIGNIYVSAYVPRAVMIQHEQEMKKNPAKKTLKFKYGRETKIPQKIIDAAPRMGRFDDYGSQILKEYNIQVDLNDSKKYLKELGAWSSEELNNLEDNKLRLIWVAILDCKENKTNIWYMGI